MLSLQSPIRVLIVDDHPVMRTGLRMLLESQASITVVAETDNCASALALSVREQPHIILLDLDLGGTHSLGIIPRLVDAVPRGRVIILTGVRDTDLHQEAIRLGAVGLVLKEQAAETLLEAIERVHAGEAWLERTMMARVLGRMTRISQHLDPEVAKIGTLTKREREIITLICEGLRNKQIAARLFISETTVRHHLTSIFGKLGVADRLELVIYAYRYSLARLSPNESPAFLTFTP